MIAPRIRAAGALVVCLLTTWFLHSEVLDYWWWLDDSQILRHTLAWPLWEIFTVPTAWRDLVPYSFTPWLSATYFLDFILFGLDARGFYAHGLIAVAVCAWLIFMLLRRWVGDSMALAGSVVFLAAPPVAMASQQLMVRHYVEGLAFFLLALWLAIEALERKDASARQRLAWISGTSFFVALMAKEIFLPLGALVLMLPGAWRARLSVAAPWAIAGVLYVLWRAWMLGDVVGGYVPVSTLMAEGSLAKMFGQFKLVAYAVLSPWGLITLGTAMALIVLSAAHRGQAGLALLGRGAGAATIVMMLLAAPLIPLALGGAANSMRFYIVPWAALVAGLCLGLGRALPTGVAGRMLALGVMGALGLAVLPSMLAQQATERGLHDVSLLSG